MRRNPVLEPAPNHAGKRKSVEPMAARVAPTEVSSAHQRLHHFVADAPWSDEAVLGAVRDHVLEAAAKVPVPQKY